jgi:O-acetyl-ADP-ribose deacetylase
VIHAVGPVWHGGTSGEDDLLASCYRTSLALAVDGGARTVAFPSISTGVYRFPIERAAQIAVKTVAEMLAREPRIAQVIFCCFNAPSAAAHRAAIATLT